MPLSTQERDVIARLAKRGTQLRADLAAWVAIPTKTGFASGLDEMRDVVTRRLRALGATVELHPGDASPVWLSERAQAEGVPPPTAVCARPVSGLPRILLCGHLDTVHDPALAFRSLTPTADGTRATGPGAADMKGGVLVAVAALEALAETGVPVSWTFALNSDEETGSYHSDAALRAQARRHDVGLVFEPALPDGSLVIERPGSGQFYLEARGKAAHVGRDFASGVSAVAALAHAITTISAHADPTQGRIVNVGVLSGGRATNIVPDSAQAWGNVRFASDLAQQQLSAALDALPRQLPATGPGAGATLRVERSFARPSKPTTPAVRRLAEVARSAASDLGQTMPFGTTGGVCDGNNLQAEGIPVIDTLGVRGGGLHTTEEWVDLTSLVERAQLAAVLLMRLTEGGLNNSAASPTWAG